MKLYQRLLQHPIWLIIGVAFIIRILPATVRFVIGSDDGLFLTLGQNLAAGVDFNRRDGDNRPYPTFRMVRQEGVGR